MVMTHRFPFFLGDEIIILHLQLYGKFFFPSPLLRLLALSGFFMFSVRNRPLMPSAFAKGLNWYRNCVVQH